MEFNYQKICQDLVKDLPQKQKEVILRRFGLSGRERETLESVGQSFGITRERVRQIEAEGLRGVRPKADKYKKIFSAFRSYFQKIGGVRREELVFGELGEGRWGNQVYFLLSLAGGSLRFGESRDFYPCWALTQDFLARAKEEIENIYNQLQTRREPADLKTFLAPSRLNSRVLESYLGISKRIQKNSENLYGLKNWPEINPRGVRDKAFLVFKQAQKPLHFSEVSKLIEGSLMQTVHNELIRDARFVLVGRGIYALKDWGYEPGQVKDVISNTLKKENKPLAREEILEKVLQQRMVKPNTVFLNLGNKKYFSRDPQGKYFIREA